MGVDGGRSPLWGALGGAAPRKIEMFCGAMLECSDKQKPNEQHINYDDDNYRQLLHVPNVPDDPSHTRSGRVDNGSVAPGLESQHLDRNPKLRRTMGTGHDRRRARKFTGVLLPNSITNSLTIPAKHSHVRESSGDKEHPPRRRAHILRRNTQAVCLRFRLLRGRHSRWRRILVLRRVPQVCRRTGQRMNERRRNITFR